MVVNNQVDIPSVLCLYKESCSLYSFVCDTHSVVPVIAFLVALKAAVLLACRMHTRNRVVGMQLSTPFADLSIEATLAALGMLVRSPWIGGGSHLSNHRWRLTVLALLGNQGKITVISDRVLAEINLPLSHRQTMLVVEAIKVLQFGF